jgi:hypothetical protein
MGRPRVRRVVVVQEGSPSGEPFVFDVFRADGAFDGRITVDYADRDYALRHSWFVASDGYAYRNLSHRTEGRGHVAMHRELLGLAKGDPQQGEHENRKKLDNRRSNLRVSTQGENLQNASKRRTHNGGGMSSRHRGVSLYTAAPTANPWRARVQVNGDVKAGYFATEEEAASAAARWRRELMPFATD